MDALATRCHHFFGSSKVWPRLQTAYGEPHRAYHTLQHLSDLFEVLQPHLPATEHAQAIELAVWFHDFVYEVSPAAYPRNESLSAKAMVQVLARAAPHWLAEPILQEVHLAEMFILATKRHSLEGVLWPSGGAQRAGQLFLDADLSTPAAPTDRFATYDSAIAVEWGQDPQQPAKAFCEGRAQALRAFLQRPALYRSPALHHLEKAARLNLQASVEHWEALARGGSAAPA